MLDILKGMTSGFLESPQWVIYWVFFMMFLFFLSIPFSLQRKNAKGNRNAARWILVGTLFFAPMIMMLVYAKFGFERVMGIGHVVGWAPTMFYLWRRRSGWGVSETLTGKWIAVTFVVMAISLLFDVADVVRYMLGERNI